jgi:6,7-dimethyl-8-ribityllumazine synthase
VFFERFALFAHWLLLNIENMASSLKNLSDYNIDAIPAAKDMKFGIVVSEWNYEITGSMAVAAIDTLKQHGAKEENITLKHVPGSYELTLGAQYMADYTNVDAIICIGCVIKGETPHFEYICQAVAQGITRVSLDNNIPVIFGVLTTNNLEQAKDRSGGKHGNKGVEAAVTAIKMVALGNDLSESAGE